MSGKKNNKVVGTIQARMGSSRLPGKVMRNVCGKPLLGWQISRIKQSRLLDEVIVATSTNSLDDEIANYCDELGVRCYRGDENDVLHRIASVIKEYNIYHHVEFCGDSPLIDYHIIDTAIGLYFKFLKKHQCVYNASEISYPPGQDVMVYKGKYLLDLDEKIEKNSPKREHVGFNLLSLDNFSIYSLKARGHYHFPEIYLEVDTKKDFDFIEKIITHFHNRNKDYFSLSEIIDFLSQKPELSKINKNEHRRWKDLKDNLI